MQAYHLLQAYLPPLLLHPPSPSPLPHLIPDRRQVVVDDTCLAAVVVGGEHLNKGVRLA
jgi:hypothetical protein